MPSFPPRTGLRPAWYRRLPPSLRRVAARSDAHPAIALVASASLAAAVGELAEALAGGRPAAVEAVAQRVADGVCRALGVKLLRVRVETRRPRDQRGELHGLYEPGRPGRADVITLWMLTAQRGQVVAYRTFLRTLLHELCHHLDYELLGLPTSLHTQGFYQRESSLFGALGVDRIEASTRRSAAGGPA
jgi:hypothetical protein